MPRLTKTDWSVKCNVKKKPEIRKILFLHRNSFVVVYGYGLWTIKHILNNRNSPVLHEFGTLVPSYSIKNHATVPKFQENKYLTMYITSHLICTIFMWTEPGLNHIYLYPNYCVLNVHVYMVYYGISVAIPKFSKEVYFKNDGQYWNLT